MGEASSEVAAVVLEHSERIRILTRSVERQRRSVTLLIYLVVGLMVLQVLSLVFFQVIARFLFPSS